MKHTVGNYVVNIIDLRTYPSSVLGLNEDSCFSSQGLNSSTGAVSFDTDIRVLLFVFLGLPTPSRRDIWNKVCIA